MASTKTTANLKSVAKRQSQAIDTLNHKIALAYFKLGRTLAALKEEAAYGEWLPTLEQLGIDRTRAARAKCLAEHFQEEEELEGLTLDTALKKAGFGTKQPRTPKPPTQAPAMKVVKPGPEEDDQEEDDQDELEDDPEPEWTDEELAELKEAESLDKALLEQAEKQPLGWQVTRDDTISDDEWDALSEFIDVCKGWQRAAQVFVLCQELSKKRK